MNIVFSEKEGSAKFYGEGTFEAKEDIKNLGNARWLPNEKTWEVLNLSVTKDELKEIFPAADFLENEVSEDRGSSSSLQSRAEPVKKVDSKCKEYSVTELSNSLRQAMKAAFPVPVLVFGVINKVNQSAKGTYIELSDTKKRDNHLNCSVWGSVEKVFKPLSDAGFKLEKDLEVMFEVSVSLSAKGGRVFLTINRVIADYTVQKLAAQREITNQKLKKEGLYDKNKELQLPKLPKKLAVLTSKTGTVINDFLDSLAVSDFGFEVTWLPVVVQGDLARKEVVAGINYFSLKADDYDALLVFRGGGAPAELAIFNDYEIAKAICNCKLPVICAIGHQEDETSAQDVAYQRLGVPKDIGRFFSDIILNLRDTFISNISKIETKAKDLHQARVKDFRLGLMKLGSSSKETFSYSRDRFSRNLGSLPSKCNYQLSSYNQALLKSSSSVISGTKANLQSGVHSFLRDTSSLIGGLNRAMDIRAFSTASSKIVSGIEQCLTSSLYEVKNLEGRVKDLDPKVQLKRGFALVKDSKGNYIKNVEVAKQSEQMSLALSDGTIEIKPVKD